MIEIIEHISNFFSVSLSRRPKQAKVLSYENIVFTYLIITSYY